MFARKHLLRWLTTAYRQPEPLPNSRACIYPCRHRRLIAHPAPPVELYALAATGKRVDHSNQRGGYRLHVRSRCAISPSGGIYPSYTPSGTFVYKSLLQTKTAAQSGITRCNTTLKNAGKTVQFFRTISVDRTNNLPRYVEELPFVRRACNSFAQ